MFRFILGLVIGAVAAAYFMRSEYARQMDLDAKLEEFQDRASAVLSESRRILEETREQFRQVAESARASAERES